MSSSKVARRERFSPEQREQYRQDKRAEQREQVERAVRELLTSEGWRKWAETRATFHDYSMGNCMLIAMQRPDATQVAGFKAWQELGRQVRKGEHGIRILAPMVVKDREADDDDATRVLFRSVSVFDVAQTDGEPLPEPPREPITGDSHERYIEPLKDLARSMGIAVYEYEPTSAAQGFYDEKGARIVISTELAPNGKVRTLIHELAHAHGVTYQDYSRAADAEAGEQFERVTRRELREADSGFRRGAANCFVCGRFKARPADTCSHCGDVPTQHASDRGDIATFNRAAMDTQRERDGPVRHAAAACGRRRSAARPGRQASRPGARERTRALVRAGADAARRTDGA